jgi:nitrite reductase/ring-hydroxylating ferredoxin subunit/uncharacterized membrane protein
MNETRDRLNDIVRSIEELDILDAPARALAPLVDRLTRDDAVKSALSGTWLGHRLHPLLTDVVVGSWLSATVVDLVAWHSGERAARRLVATGIAAAIPTIATGLSDWDDTSGRDRRVGVAHLLVNSTGVSLQMASWVARVRRHHIRGALLSAAALAAVSAGGYLGGHLVFARRAGVDHEVPVVVADDGWQAACRVDELVDGEAITATVAGNQVAVVRSRGQIYALAAVCSHAGGPLDRGTVRDGTLVCPWHGSAFCLADGAVERGPATAPQPAYETRTRGDLVEVRATADDRPIVRAVV